ncbi:MAG: DUF2141 domain-containing protein [Synechococcales cyanobacterium RM1_1_8]|nr:DUF2141 domain-containing protein [Synechococcales cyanobacterium RM1_1_8]
MGLSISLGLSLGLASLGLASGGIVLTPGTSVALTAAADLNIDVTGLRNQKGVVCVALFDGPAGFPADGTKAVSNKCFKIGATTQRVNLGQVRYGRYALSILHDENEDQKLNTGFLGIPKEGIGFSKNPRIKRQLPFDETSFEFASGSAPLKVVMRYF